MDFRFLPLSTYDQSHSSSFLHDAEQARNPYISPFEGLQPMHRALFNDVLQRECEKSRIRCEVLMSIAYKQGLEDAIVNKQDYAGVGRRRSVVEGNSTENLPFSGDCVPVLTETKPNLGSDIGRTKRKNTSKPMIGFGEPSVITKKKLKKDWSCSICEIMTPNDKALNDHLSGKKHKLKENQLRRQSSSTNDHILVKKSIVGNPSCTVNKAGKRKNAKKNIKKFQCEMCNVRTDTEKVMNRHKKGQKHMEKLQNSSVVNCNTLN